MHGLMDWGAHVYLGKDFRKSETLRKKVAAKTWYDLDSGGQVLLAIHNVQPNGAEVPAVEKRTVSNGNGAQKATTVALEKLSAEDVGVLIASLGFEKYREAFVSGPVDGETFAQCDHQDLTDLGVRFGPHRTKLMEVSRITMI